MTEKEKLESSLIRLLGDIISEEVQKPDDQADMKLIDECEQMLAVLMDGKYDLSEEQIKENIQVIKNKTVLKQDHTSRRSRRAIPRVAAILCALFIMLSIGVTAVSIVNPEVVETLLEVLKLHEGDSLKQDGITFTRGGKVMEYSSVDEMLNEISVDILFFKDLPDNKRIERVTADGDGIFPIHVFFNDSNMWCYIYKHAGLDASERAEGNEVIQSGDRTYFISDKDEYYIGSYFHKELVYQISYPKKDVLISMLDSIK